MRIAQQHSDGNAPHALWSASAWTNGLATTHDPGTGIIYALATRSRSSPTNPTHCPGSRLLGHGRFIMLFYLCFSLRSTFNQCGTRAGRLHAPVPVCLHEIALTGTFTRGLRAIGMDGKNKIGNGHCCPGVDRCEWFCLPIVQDRAAQIGAGGRGGIFPHNVGRFRTHCFGER